MILFFLVLGLLFLVTVASIFLTIKLRKLKRRNRELAAEANRLRECLRQRSAENGPTLVQAHASSQPVHSVVLVGTQSGSPDTDKEKLHRAPTALSVDDRA